MTLSSNTEAPTASTAAGALGLPDGAPRLIAEAQRYAARGWRALPLHHVIDGRCSCGNPKAVEEHDYRQGGKHPVHKSWQNDASTDWATVARWWQAEPRANIGIATGEASGIFVFDVDPENGGFDSLNALETKYGLLPTTYRVETGSGGLHFYFTWPGFNPKNSAGKLGPGLDIKADGGQVVAPPSVSVKGPYTLRDDTEPVPAPAWLVDMLRPPPPREPLPPGAFVALVADQDAYTQKVVQEECDNITRAPVGDQNNQINKASFNIGQIVGAGGLNEAEMRTVLLSAALAGNHPEGRARSAIASGITSGMAKPRHPWPPVSRQDDHNDFSALLVPEDKPAEPSAPEEEPSENPTQARLAQLRAALVDSDGLDSIPDPVPLIDGILFKDSLAWLYGKPGSGKSFLALDWAAHVGTGLPWHGRKVLQGTVVYLVAEGVSGVRKRVRAWEQRYGLRMDNVLFLPVAVQLLNGIDRQALVSLVADMGPVLVVVDTQARVTVGADENSNGEMGKVVDAADKIRLACGACVEMVHHSGKNGLDMRGASAFEGAATSVIKVSKDGDQWVDVTSDKQKDVEDFAPIRLRMEPSASSVVLTATGPAGVDERSVNHLKIIQALRQSFGSVGASASALLKVTEIPERSFYRDLKTLVDAAEVIRHGSTTRPKYFLPEHAPTL